MDLLASLGFNSTVFVHFGLFLIFFFVLRSVAVEPYFQAYLKRRDASVGGEELALELVRTNEKRRQEYESRLQELNQEIRQVFAESRHKTEKEVSERFAAAQKELSEYLKQTRDQLAIQEDSLRQSLSDEVPEVTRVLRQRLLGRS